MGRLGALVRCEGCLRGLLVHVVATEHFGVESKEGPGNQETNAEPRTARHAPGDSCLSQG